MVAPDPVAQPHNGQCVSRREHVAGLLGAGQGLAGGRFRRVQVAGTPLQHRQQRQAPGTPLAGQVRSRQCLPDGGNRPVVVARTHLRARKHPVRLGPSGWIGHHRQRPIGLPGRLLVGPGGEQSLYQIGHKPIRSLLPGRRLIQLPPQQVGRQLRCPYDQRGRGVDEPRPSPALTRAVRDGQLLRDAQRIRARSREFPCRLGVQRRAQRGWHAPVQRLLDQQMPERQLRAGGLPQFPGNDLQSARDRDGQQGPTKLTVLMGCSPACDEAGARTGGGEAGAGARGLNRALRLRCAIPAATSRHHRGGGPGYPR